MAVPPGAESGLGQVGHFKGHIHFPDGRMGSIQVFHGDGQVSSGKFQPAGRRPSSPVMTFTDVRAESMFPNAVVAVPLDSGR